MVKQRKSDADKIFAALKLVMSRRNSFRTRGTCWAIFPSSKRKQLNKGNNIQVDSWVEVLFVAKKDESGEKWSEIEHKS